MWVASRDGSLLVNTGHDRRVRVWESVKSDIPAILPPRQIFNPAHHLDMEFSCSSVCLDKAIGKGAKEGTKSYLALGTMDGMVVVWDLMRRECVTTLGLEDGSGHVGRVTSTDVGVTLGGKVFVVSVGVDKTVRRWRVDKPTKSASSTTALSHTSPSAITIPTATATRLPSLAVVAGTSSIALVDIASLTVTAEAAVGAHPALDIAAVMSGESVIAAVCSLNHRGIHLVTFAHDATATSRAIQFDDLVSHVSLTRSLEDPRMFHATAISNSSIRTLQGTLPKKPRPSENDIAAQTPSKKKRKTDKGVVSPPAKLSQAPTHNPARGVEWEIGSSLKLHKSKQTKSASVFYGVGVGSGDITAVYGESESPTFHTIASSKIVDGAELTPLIVDNPSLSKTGRVVTKGKVSAVTISGHLIPAAHPADKGGDGASELSLQEKVKDMAFIVQPERKLVHKADSVAAVIVQGLHSNDTLLLEHALQSGNDHRLVDRTIREVPATSILPLLNALVDRITRRPQRAVELTRWIRAILHLHTAMVLASPDASAALARLSALLSSRVAPFQNLLALQGRLELVLAQDRLRRDSSGDAVSSIPTAVYNEEDGSEEDAEEMSENSEDGGSEEEGEEGEGAESVSDAEAESEEEEGASDLEMLDEDESGED